DVYRKRSTTSVPASLSSSYLIGWPPSGTSTITLTSCGGSRPIRIASMRMLAREAVHAAVDVDHLARDVARERRGEERDQVRHVFGIAEVAERNVRVDE